MDSGPERQQNGKEKDQKISTERDIYGIFALLFKDLKFANIFKKLFEDVTV
jgi:hypothetical protein